MWGKIDFRQPHGSDGKDSYSRAEHCDTNLPGACRNSNSGSQPNIRGSGEIVNIAATKEDCACSDKADRLGQALNHTQWVGIAARGADTDVKIERRKSDDACAGTD